ncbi:hypothetical protein SCA03_52260 [Streptomyces cacaoi]|uniref:HEPN domain-containing protein n=1 Tax=Streptomyces cacaoi TaxID=1898 RepID=A0A4Y3R4V9_STRCI|nr:hypothetical protein SCA03_52260 [Streptomyces cacaoi]
MAVEVGLKALRASRDRLQEAARREETRGHRSVSCLLLFYAVECALKECALRRRGKRDTGQLDRTHDLRSLAKELMVPGHLSVRLRNLGSCRLRHGSGTVGIAQLHEAWRYGATLREEDEKEAHAALCALMTWCEQDF